MFFSSFRSDPFAAARREAGFDPSEDRISPFEDRTAAPRRRVGATLVAVLTACSTVLVLSTSPASGAPEEVKVRQEALSRATAARVKADARVVQVGAQLEEVQAEVDRLGAEDERLTEDLAEARRELREFAVAAYIDGGQSEIIRSSLSPEKAVALSWQSNMAFGRSMSADEAADRFHELREANTPARREAAARLDRVSSELQEARFDAIQAAAHERDAEAALTKARQAAERARAEQARAEKAAADRAAAQRAAAQRAEAQRAARTASTRAASTSPSPTPAPQPSAPAGGGSSANGNPTWDESATLARIRNCESGGDYGAVSASGRYRGAYQFDRGTWGSVGGSGDPAAASPDEQDYRALILLRQRGTRPWPVCGR